MQRRQSPKERRVGHEGGIALKDREGMETKKCHMRIKTEITNDTQLTGMSTSRKTFLEVTR